MTLFSKIIVGEIPCYKIAENEKFLAFLDIFPAMPGHILVIPKVETDRLFDLPETYLKDILVFAKPVARAIQNAFNADRVNIITIGFEVPHAHIHLLPMNNMHDMNLFPGKKKASDEALKTVQEKIVKLL
ncbi:MAG: HIT family protein [Bacteroidetes bacterium]|nr:HIT family protein [Bacteroidota bacterium]